MTGIISANINNKNNTLKYASCCAVLFTVAGKRKPEQMWRKRQQ